MTMHEPGNPCTVRPRLSKTVARLPPAKALGRVLEHGNGRFWYDTHANGIWAIDAVLADVLPLWEGGDDEKVAAELADRHPGPAVRRAIREIQAARRDEGLFRSERPPSAVPDPGSREPWNRGLGHLTLSLTEACNLRCGYCPQTLQSTPHRTMTAAVARAAVRFFALRSADAPLRNISFYGGEPLLQRSVVAAVADEIALHGDWPPLRLTVDTNATLIDDETAAWVAATGAYLQVSCDGPAGVHDRYRRAADGGSTHHLVMAGLRRVLRADPTAVRRISFVATLGPPFPFSEVADWFRDFPLYRELGIDHVPTVRVNAAAPGGRDPGPMGRDRTRALADALAAAERLYMDAHLGGRRDALAPALRAMFDGDLVRWHRRARGPLPASAFPAGVCRPGVRRLFVQPDGTLLPCERVAPDVIIGHLDHGFDFPAMERLQSRLLDFVGGDCGGCWAQQLCGVCLAVLDMAPGTTPGACAAVRRRAESTLRRSLELGASPPEARAFLSKTLVY